MAEAAIEMYVFAKAYDIPRLRQDAMDRIIWCNNKSWDSSDTGTFVCASTIKRAYEHLEAGNYVRNWLISGFSAYSSYEREDITDLLHEYMVDVLENYKLNEMGHEGSLIANFMLPSCAYHEHATQLEKDECVSRVDFDRPVGE